jgi:hypothetical protein
MVEDKAYCNKNFSKFPSIKSDIVNNSLLISTNALALGKTLERISYNLNAEYEDAIKKKEFSWSKSLGRWRKFEDEEMELIKTAK